MQFPLRDEGMLHQPLPPNPLQEAAAYISGMRQPFLQQAVQKNERSTHCAS